MADKKIFLLAFPDGQAQWQSLEGNSLIPAEEPPAKGNALVIALLPDSFFFYHQPMNLQAKSPKALRTAATLQFQHAFPPLPEGWGAQFLRPVKGQLLGLIHGPELQEFLERHREILARANTVTTAFVLTWFAAAHNGISVWTWAGGSGEKALASPGRLFYFRAGQPELEARIRTRLPAGETPIPLELDAVLSNLAASHPRWSQFRIPVQLSTDEKLETGPLRRAAIICTAIVLFFLAGQIIRLNIWKGRLTDLRQELQALYSAALGPDLGSDPYGKLLYSLTQLRSGGSQGFDVLGCLQTVSAGAPDTFLVEGVNFSGDSGVVTGTIKTYEQLDSLMNALKDQSRFQFTLDQAVNTDKGIRLSLRVAALR